MLKLKNLVKQQGRQMKIDFGFPNLKKQAKLLGRSVGLEINYNYNQKHRKIVVGTGIVPIYDDYAGFGTRVATELNMKKSNKIAEIKFQFITEQLPNYKRVIINGIKKAGYQIIGNNLIKLDNQYVSGNLIFKETTYNFQYKEKGYKPNNKQVVHCIITLTDNS